MKMTNYEKKAINFLNDCNGKIFFTFAGCFVNHNWNDNFARNCYNVTIITPLGSMGIMFWDSVYNTKHNIRPTKYDVLACLQKYDVGTYRDFCMEFGYNMYDENTEDIYNACVKEYNDILRIFTTEQIEALQEIN